MDLFFTTIPPYSIYQPTFLFVYKGPKLTKKRIISKIPAELLEKGALSHPDHSAELIRLKRVKGQIEGLERMILDRRYCTDIIIQTKAAKSALKAFESAVLQQHLRGCVKSAMQSKNAFEAEEKIQEILDILK